MPSLSVKVYRDGEIRRFHLEIVNEDGQVGLNSLTAKIQEVFPDLQGGKFELSWKDSDGDLVKLTNPSDLKEAMANLPTQDPILRLHLTDAGHMMECNQTEPKEVTMEGEEVKPVDTMPKSVEPEEDPSLHAGVMCDGCQGAVRGIRFKCLTCPNFDLCSGCIEVIGHEEHPMLRIASPLDHTWREAFTASQALGFLPKFGHCGRGRNFGHCPGGRCTRPHACHGEELKEPEVTKEPAQEGKQEPSAPFDEEVVEKVTGAIDAIFKIFGGQTGAGNQSDGQGPASGQSQDQKIDAALKYMLAMGYRNDGRYLRKLLEDKRGDVSAVIDLLHQM